MTQKEAINEIISYLGFIIEEIRNHEKYADKEQNEFQIRNYTNNKRKIEAYALILGSIDSSLSTMDGIYERYLQFNAEMYGSSDAGSLPEPSEYEQNLYDLLKDEEDVFELDDEENEELAKINVEEGSKRVLIDTDPEDSPDLSEDDTFDFTAYQGRIIVGYNGYSDGDFCTYPESFQKRAYEIIKGKIENE